MVCADSTTRTQEAWIHGGCEESLQAPSWGQTYIEVLIVSYLFFFDIDIDFGLIDFILMLMQA